MNSEDIRKIAKQVGDAARDLEKEAAPESMMRRFRQRFRSATKGSSGGASVKKPSMQLKAPEATGSSKMTKGSK